MNKKYCTYIPLLLISLTGFFGFALGLWFFPKVTQTTCILINSKINGTTLNAKMQGYPDFEYYVSEEFNTIEELDERLQYLSVEHNCYCNKSYCSYNYQHVWIIFVPIIEFGCSLILLILYVVMIQHKSPELIEIDNL